MHWTPSYNNSRVLPNITLGNPTGAYLTSMRGRNACLLQRSPSKRYICRSQPHSCRARRIVGKGNRRISRRSLSCDTSGKASLLRLFFFFFFWSNTQRLVSLNYKGEGIIRLGLNPHISAADRHPTGRAESGEKKETTSLVSGTVLTSYLRALAMAVSGFAPAVWEHSELHHPSMLVCLL